MAGNPSRKPAKKTTKKPARRPRRNNPSQPQRRRRRRRRNPGIPGWGKAIIGIVVGTMAGAGGAMALDYTKYSEYTKAGILAGAGTTVGGVGMIWSPEIGGGLAAGTNAVALYMAITSYMSKQKVQELQNTGASRPGPWPMPRPEEARRPRTFAAWTT